MDKLIYIECPLCTSIKYQVVYSRKQYAGQVLGDFQTDLVMCDNCGFVYMNPRPTIESISLHYKSSSSGDTFHQNQNETRHGLLTSERKVFIETNLVGIDPGFFLDIGCGQGDLLKSLDIDNWKKFGLEPSPAVSSQKLSDITIINDYIENMTLYETKYDVISCISSLEHFYNPLEVMFNISKILKDEGLLFIEVPDSLDPTPQIAEFYSFEHLSHFTHFTLELLLSFYKIEIIRYDNNVSISNIRCVAKKTNKKIDVKAYDNRVFFKQVLVNYLIKRENIINSISDRILYKLELIKKKNGTIAIYGAGIHTYFLLNTFNIEMIVSCFIDSDPKKWGNPFRNRIIKSPLELPNIDVCALLISSHDYENEIFNTIKSYNKNNIPVIKCYSN